MNQKRGDEILLIKFFTMVPKLDYNDKKNNNMLHYLVKLGNTNLVL